MNKIIAKGKHHINISVIEDDGKIRIFINGEEEDIFKKLLDGMAEIAPPMGGTFYPEKGTMLAYYNVLKNSFYSRLFDEVTVEGDIGEIPYEEGVIY